MACRTLVIEQAAVRHGDHTRRRIDGKPTSRRIGQTVRLRVPRIGIGPTHRPYHGAGGGVLRHAVRRQAQVTRGHIRIGNVVINLHVVDE